MDLSGWGPFKRDTERKIKLGQYLFKRYGVLVVFFGRFVAVLRVLAAFLAGVNCMHWPRFFLANLSGAVLWAALFGFGAYVLGDTVHHYGRPLGIAAIVIAVLAMVAALIVMRRHEEASEAEAERALPGPLRRP